ncbi:MAG: site-specific integrase, partial [Bacillota bacterium]
MMTKRRGNKEGSIYFRNMDGTWRAQITLDGRRLSHTAKTRGECQEWLKKTIQQIDGGLSYSGAKMALKD